MPAGTKSNNNSNSLLKRNNDDNQDKQQTYVKQFKKLYITQGALSASKQFRLNAKDILNKESIEQWWGLN